MITRIAIFTGLLLLLSSCVMTEEFLPATTIEIEIINNIDCRDLDVKLTYGGVDILNQCRYKLNFYDTSGGVTYWIFSKMVISDQSPGKTTKAIISKDEKEIRQVSYNEIIKLDFVEKDGVKIYQLKME